MYKPFFIMIATFLLCLSAISVIAKDKSANPEHWEMAGNLTEACSCDVPCTCNFGEGPSPYDYCHAIYSLEIVKGHYGSVKLDGLHLAGVHGNKSKVWYIDANANPEQAAALRVIADHIIKSEHISTAVIDQKIGEKGNALQIGDKGGFEADYIIGFDKKTPVVVENNTTWNIQHSIKAKTKQIRYRDEFGNNLEFTGTNSNQGKFDWTDETERYL